MTRTQELLDKLNELGFKKSAKNLEKIEEQCKKEDIDEY